MRRERDLEAGAAGLAVDLDPPPVVAQVELVQGYRDARRGAPPQSDALAPLLERHRAWVGRMWDRPCPPEAYAGLADALGNLANYERAKTAALRAIELDPSLAEAHSALGIVKAFYEHDLASAEDGELGPLERRLFRTGFSIAVPEGYECQLRPRSGLALRRAEQFRDNHHIDIIDLRDVAL